MIKIGTRSSQLALAQATEVQSLLASHGVEGELVHFETKGDKILDRALDKIGGKGLFTTELENALLEGRIDIAVHSLKDLPTDLGADLQIGAYVLPEDHRDVLLAAAGTTWQTLPQGARIGTSSLRRQAFLKLLRPDVEIIPVRGNLQTRVRKWHDNGWDGLILAAAGVIRLGWAHLIAQYLEPYDMVPAPGQGILAIELRADSDLLPVMAELDDPVAATRAVAERSVLAILEGGCQIPMGAYADVSGARVTLLAKVAAPLGGRAIIEQVSGDTSDVQALGEQVGRGLIERGARALIEVQP